LHHEEGRILVSDNAYKNDSTTKLICDAIHAGTPYLQFRLRCTGHVVNLVAEAIMDSKHLSKIDKQFVRDGDAADSTLWTQGGPMMKLQRLGVYLARSPQRRERFLESQKHPQVQRDDDAADADTPLQWERTKVLNLPHAGGVRWNSVYLMIQRGIQLKAFVNNFLDDEISYHDYPAAGRIAADERQQLQAYCRLLQHLFDLTKCTEGIASDGSHGALWEVIPLMQHLFKELERLDADEDPAGPIPQGMASSPISAIISVLTFY
jgi:hypothetical protein